LAGEHPLIATAPGDWDRDPWLLGTPGGVVDLRTGELRPDDPTLLVSKSTVVTPGGDCPLWLKTLDEIFEGDREVIAFAKRHAGYILTGSIKEEKLVFALGGGGNGKGTVFETLAYVMGEYAMSCPIETLVQTHGSQHPTEIAQFQAKRFALASEPDEAHRWNTARVKLLTGGDRLRARVMRGDFFDFEPTHKLVITGNDTPRFGRIDAAIKRRLILWTFDATFATQDLELKERLEAEAEGILSWMIEGCQDWQRVGLAVPKSIAKHTEQYLAKADDIEIFIGDCLIDAPGKKTSGTTLYEAWLRWCQANRVMVCSKHWFTRRLKEVLKWSEGRGHVIDYHDVDFAYGGEPF
jgi:putative DNA primase/helicase